MRAKSSALDLALAMRAAHQTSIEKLFVKLCEASYLGLGMNVAFFQARSGTMP